MPLPRYHKKSQSTRVIWIKFECGSKVPARCQQLVCSVASVSRQSVASRFIYVSVSPIEVWVGVLVYEIGRDPSRWFRAKFAGWVHRIYGVRWNHAIGIYMCMSDIPRIACCLDKRIEDESCGRVPVSSTSLLGESILHLLDRVSAIIDME